MCDTEASAAAAYLDVAQPKDKPWTSGDARRWLDERSREAKGVKACIDYLLGYAVGD